MERARERARRGSSDRSVASGIGGGALLLLGAMGATGCTVVHQHHIQVYSGGGTPTAAAIEQMELRRAELVECEGLPESHEAVRALDRRIRAFRRHGRRLELRGLREERERVMATGLSPESLEVRALDRRVRALEHALESGPEADGE
jgi:hypothetical protein